jgi:murein L,D-transpeptidase YafK
VLFALAVALLFACADRVLAEEDLPPSLTHEEQTAPPGFFAGNPVLIRVFKEEAELELWMQNAGRFELFATYPICFWSGSLGPKEYEGDRQAPEGFYTVGAHQLITSGKHPRSLDIGFPNTFDRSLGRTGSHILLHGGCRSIGCFAMTDPVMDKIYALVEGALLAGQPEIQVHIFPFRMTDANLQRHSKSLWFAFWSNLKQGHDTFEARRTPPTLLACHGVYQLSDDSHGAQAGPTEGCAPATAHVADATKRVRGGRMVTLAPRLHYRHVRVAASPIAIPRDNVAECVRLWKPETRVGQQYWKEICKKLDFQPRRTVHTAHRSS